MRDQAAITKAAIISLRADGRRDAWIAELYGVSAERIRQIAGGRASGHEHETDWTDELIGQLRALWAEGHSTAEIGRRLGVTKNAIVGKAHRLDLPARPSPIRRDPDAVPVRRAPVRRVEGPTLPPLPSAVADGDAGMAAFGETPLPMLRQDFGPIPLQS